MVSLRFAILMLLTPLLVAAVANTPKKWFNRNTVFGYVIADSQSARSATEEGKAAYLSARTVLNLRNTRFGVADAAYTSSRFGELSRDGAPVYVWPFRKGANDRTVLPPVYLLRHEIGHDLFIRHLVPSTRRGQYGGDAPDWLDEMAAVAFEGEALRSIRRGSAVRYARDGKLIPLKRFLTMTHPELKTGSMSASAGQPVTIFEPRSRETLLYYTMASAFYDYLVARTGDGAIVVRLAAAFRNGEDLPQWIVARTGHGGRRNGVEALNADFVAWIAADPRYGGGSR